MLTYRIDKAKNQLLIAVAHPAAFAEFMAEHARKEDLQSDDTFLQAIECLLCNGLSTVRPEAIGALTDSIILSECPEPEQGASYPEDARFFWFPEYMLRSPLEELIRYGRVIFAGD